MSDTSFGITGYMYIASFTKSTVTPSLKLIARLLKTNSSPPKIGRPSIFMGFLLLVSGMIPPDVRDQRSWKELRGSWKFRRGNSTRISPITRYYDICTNIEMYATYKIIMYIGDVFNIFQSYLMIDIIIIIITIYCSPVLVWNFRSFFAASHQLHQVVISCPLHCRKWSMSCHDKKPDCC